MLKHLFTGLAMLIATVLYSQTPVPDNTWTLRRCITYAQDHNLAIKQKSLDEQTARLRRLQSNLSQLPNINANAAYGKSHGRSIDPVSNVFVEEDYKFLTMSGNADALLFGFLQKRNFIAEQKLTHQAVIAELDQLRDDISLNVTALYLNAILAKGQIDISKKQVELSRAQMNQTNQYVLAGLFPDLSRAQMESQLARDSANLIMAISNYNSSLLELKALLNLDLTLPFDIRESTGVNTSAQTDAINPEQVYQTANITLGRVKASELQVSAAKKRLWAAKGALLPRLGVAAQIGTGYADITQTVVNTGTQNTVISGNYVNINGDTYPIYQNTPVYAYMPSPFSDQINNNFRNNIALTLNIPLFNAWTGYLGMKEAKINMQSREINRQNVNIQLRKDVYKACNEVTNAMQRYNAAERSQLAAVRAYDYIRERYSLGIANTVEYLMIQNVLYESDYLLLTSRYDLLLKMKIVDYYMGRDIVL